MASPTLKNALDIIELEDRFEMTVASVDTGRCNSNEGKVTKEAEAPAEAPAEG